MPQETLYTARFNAPDMLQRAMAQTIELPVYRDGALAAPSSGTVFLFKEDGTAVVDAQAVTVASSIATYDVLAADLPATDPVSTLWWERWDLTLDGQSYRFTREAWLVLRQLYPVVTDLDLTAVHTELRDWMAQDSSSLQGYIDEAWRQIESKLLNQGRRPNLILSPHALRDPHWTLSMALIWTDYSSHTDRSGKYQALADMYREQFKAAWAALRFTYDFDEDGEPGTDEQGHGAEPVVVLGAPGNWRLGDG